VREGAGGGRCGVWRVCALVGVGLVVLRHLGLCYKILFYFELRGFIYCLLRNDIGFANTPFIAWLFCSIRYIACMLLCYIIVTI